MDSVTLDLFSRKPDLLVNKARSQRLLDVVTV